MRPRTLTFMAVALGITGVLMLSGAPAVGQGPKTGGVLTCGNAANGDSMVVWTHEKLGSVDHVDMLGVARASSRGANLFGSWWGGVKDNVGKCRPLLPGNVCLATVEHFEKS